MVTLLAYFDSEPACLVPKTAELVKLLQCLRSSSTQNITEIVSCAFSICLVYSV